MARTVKKTETAGEVFARLDAAKVEAQRAVLAAAAIYSQLLAMWDLHSIEAIHQRPDWDEVLTAREAADEARIALAKLGDERAAAQAAVNGRQQ